jgi:hypothetical protein
MININIDRMKKICQASSPSDVLAGFKYCKGDYWYKDNNSKILAVAHFDTVSFKNPDFSLIKDKKNKIIGVQSIQLDDRLGVYLITELQKKYCNFDILITNDEEKGMSTASNFIIEKQYNWIFQFDRRGINPVLYEYGSSAEWYNSINSVSKIDYGSFSDISELTFLNCCGVNFGTGYNLEHSEDCYCLFSDIKICIKKFLQFYEKNKDIYYPYEPINYNYYNNSNNYYNNICDDYFISQEWKEFINKYNK